MRNNCSGKKKIVANTVVGDRRPIIFIKIDRHFEKLYTENKGVPILWNRVYFTWRKEKEEGEIMDNDCFQNLMTWHCL